MDEKKGFRVSAATWTWRTDAGEDDGPCRADRKRVVAEFCVGLVLGLLVFHVFHKAILGTIVFSIAGLALVSGLCIPRLHAWIRMLGLWLGRVVGIGLSWILLAPFFYVFFSLGRLFVAVSGKDPLQRRFPGGQNSYWHPHLPLGKERYKRQH